MVDVKQKIALALTGASGAVYFTRLLERLGDRSNVELHLIASEGGRRVLLEELDLRWKDLNTSHCVVHPNPNYGSSIASGSYGLQSLAVVPCSMGTISAIAAGLAETLIQRCASVQLKESRQLLLVPRETPLSLIHLRAMVALKEAGATILPAMPSFYSQPQTVSDLVDTVIDRILDHLHIDDPKIKRWRG